LYTTMAAHARGLFMGATGDQWCVWVLYRSTRSKYESVLLLRPPTA
jgi:hypothetical protein